MNNSERIAYLKGMVAVMSDRPTAKQWDEIKTILAEASSNEKQQPIQAPKRKR